MPSQVTPCEASVPGDTKMSSSISVQPITNDAPIASDSISDEENVNEQLLKTIDEIYSPMLKLMKMFGMYFGDTRLNRLTYASGRCRKRLYFPGIYCALVVSGFWLNVVMSFVDIFFGNNPFLFVLFSLWCLLIALSGTIFLIVLCVPLADTTKSRFENFLLKLLAIRSNANLEKVKRRSRKGIIIFCFFFVSGSVGIITTYLLLDISIASTKPWNEWFGFQIFSIIFFIYGAGAWLIPVLFVYITCLILEELFDDLHRRMSSMHSVSVDIGAWKMEHRRLCEVVEFADKMLAPLLLGMVSVYIPLICTNFYKSVNLPNEDKFEFLTSNMFWLLTSAVILTMIMFFGSKVGEKVY